MIRGSRSGLLAGLALATPALAHTGGHVAPHVHPHDGASWLAVVAALGLAALAGRWVAARVRTRK